MDEAPPELGEAHNISIETLAQSEWLALQEIEYQDRHKRVRKYYRSIRTTPEQREIMKKRGTPILFGRDCFQADRAAALSSKCPVDAATIVPLCYHGKRSCTPGPLTKREDLEVILVKQFRPAVASYTLEFPAGLLDSGEDAKAAGLRELEEETGYVAKCVLHQSPQLVMSPGNTTESTVLLVVAVDLDDPANAKPKQCLDEGEDIEVIRVPLKNLIEELNAFSQKGGLLFEETYCLAFGLLQLGTLEVGV